VSGSFSRFVPFRFFEQNIKLFISGNLANQYFSASSSFFRFVLQKNNIFICSRRPSFRRLPFCVGKPEFPRSRERRQRDDWPHLGQAWIPAFAGMTSPRAYRE
jgi:hypothetical protein